ncbi:MAG TPA: 8-amino-7-oxononanoate synthase, partial [Spongiibacteraceae bacterium]|nr:8-amino-7-oxononanoate synthase [Spongiibacteraceae bacterium]
RTRRQISGPQQPALVSDGVPLLSFCSNDYLGLANHPEIIRAATNAMPGIGFGGAASHLICGHHDAHHQLELRLADFTRRSSALFFSTGYMANLGIINALLGKGDHIFEDRLNHASLLDGGLLSGARFQRFAHNDIADLQRRLEKSGDEGRRLIAVDAVFSMDGDLAPLPELAAVAKQNNAWLMADDAHGFGVLGAHGAGSAEHFGLSQEELPVLMGTLGKALGCFGAFVAGSEVLIETLIQFARPYIYTTAMPPAVAAANLAALDVLAEEDWRRSQLQRNIQAFREGAARLGLPLASSDTAIQPLLVGADSDALAFSERLAGQGILVSAIRPPTVPEGTARLRITLSAAHSREQIDSLLNALEQCVGRGE